MASGSIILDWEGHRCSRDGGLMRPRWDLSGLGAYKANRTEIVYPVGLEGQWPSPKHELVESVLLRLTRAKKTVGAWPS